MYHREVTLVSVEQESGIDQQSTMYTLDALLYKLLTTEKSWLS